MTSGASTRKWCSPAGHGKPSERNMRETAGNHESQSQWRHCSVFTRRTGSADIKYIVFIMSRPKSEDSIWCVERMLAYKSDGEIQVQATYRTNFHLDEQQKTDGMLTLTLQAPEGAFAAFLDSKMLVGSMSKDIADYYFALDETLA